MKNSVLFLFTTFFVFGLLIQPGCKTTDDITNGTGPNEGYTLTVTLGSGVTGTPASGTHIHEENDIVNYSYTLETGYETLVVTLDGTAIADSGSITMNSNHTLSASATELFNINGDWEGEWIDYEWYDHYTLVLNFSGGYLTGTVTGTGGWSDENVSGSYTISNGLIEFTLNNLDSVEDTWYFTGTIDDNNHMSGECSQGDELGSWTLARI